MATSDPFLAKRTLFTLLAANTGTAQPLDGVQVSYAYPRDITDRCIYGGGISFDHEDSVMAGVGTLVDESVSVGVYVRVVGRGRTQEENDVAANAIGVAMLGLIRTSSTLTTAGSWLGLGRTGGSGGLATYQSTSDEVTTQLGYQFTFGRAISY